jgi:hypothetical protein
MNISRDVIFNFHDTVYVKTDKDQLPRLIQGFYFLENETNLCCIK